jgi:CBS domain-containing protein
MQVSDVMTPNVHVVHPEQTLREVAAAMAELDIGALPVGENNRLVGMITDRDIVIRAIAEGKDPGTKVREVMSPQVKYCYEDEKVDHVAHNMGDIQVRRLPVMNRDKKLVGIVSLSDVALKRGPGVAGETVRNVSEQRTPAAEEEKPALEKPAKPARRSGRKG